MEATRLGYTLIYTPAAVPLDSLPPLAPADYRPIIENTLAYHAAAQKLKGEQIVYGNPGFWVPGYPCPPYHAAVQTNKGERIVYGNPGTRVHGCPDTRVCLIRRRSNAKRGANA